MAFREVDPGPMPEGKFWKPSAIGDKFLGVFVSKTERTANFNEGPKKVTDWSFKNREGAWIINPNADLQRRFDAADLKPGHAVRITYVSNLDTGKADPMKVFRLEVDTEWKPAAAAPPPPPPPRAPVDDDIPF